MSISLLILSKDRSAQLDLLLASNKKFCGNLYDEIIVLYNTSNSRFEEGYSKLKTKWSGVAWQKDTVFEQDVRDIANRAKGDAFCVITDDCIFYTDISSYTDQIRATIQRDDVCSFILGVGGNSTYSGTLSYYYKQPSFTKEGDVLLWNWKTADRGEFAEPVMIVGNCHRMDRFLLYLSKSSFQNPSTLECGLNHAWKISRPNEMNDLCGGLERQSLIHSWNNRVQDDFKNINGVSFPFSTHDLNERFLSGQVIDLDKLDFSRVLGLHKEINLVFKQG